MLSRECNNKTTYQILKIVIPVRSVHCEWCFFAKESCCGKTSGGGFGNDGCRWTTTRAHAAEGRDGEFAQHDDIFVLIDFGIKFSVSPMGFVRFLSDGYFMNASNTR